MPEDWGEFLVSIFEEWVRNDVGRVFVQMFEVALESWAGLPQSLCFFRETCGAALALEHNGDLYSCDHFVDPEHRLGNLLETSLGELAQSFEQRRFGDLKRDSLPPACQTCEVRFACHGECPKNRISPDGLNHLCAGYKRFFRHIHPHMLYMLDRLRRGRSPAEIMALR